jgi:phosphoribosyl-AMP cyclohydrolase
MLKFDEKGLIPVIVQDAADGTVLMLGYASKESLKLTMDRGEMVFWSRSRQELWHKGATSGNVLKVKSIAKDCDSDALLVRAEPAGPTCHTGERSCFFTGFSEKDLM